MTVRVTNAGPEADTLHVLPTAWFRNTWSWDADAPKPVLAGAGGSAVTVEHPFLGSLELLAGAGPDGTSPVPLFCENETNIGAAVRRGAGDAVPQGRDQRPCDQRRGHGQPRSAGDQVRVLVPADGRAGRHGRTAAAAAPGGRRAAAGGAAAALGSGFDRVVEQRRAEADEFYAELTPEGASAGRGDGDAAGLRRDAVEQAALQLRRGPLARR